MSDPNLSRQVTEVQRDRAVEYLQSAYAAGTLSEELFERRLEMALNATTRRELNASLHGLAQVEPTSLGPPPAARHHTHDGVQNLAAGVFHLTTIPTLFIAPAIGRAVARPGSRASIEASRAMSFQFSSIIYGVVTLILVIANVLPQMFLIVGFLVWNLMTLWLAIRAFSGEKSTAWVEPLMIMRAPEDRKSSRIR